MLSDAARDRARRRQRLQQRFAAVALPLALVGLVVRYALHRNWGEALILTGLVVNGVGYAVTALLHPKPLSEH